MVYNPLAVRVNEDATADYMLRGADLTGVADGKQFTFAFHMRLNALPGTIMRLCTNVTIRYGLHITAANQLQITMVDASGTPVDLLIARTGALSAATNYSIIFEGDLTSALQSDVRCWINDVQQTLTFTVGPTNTAIDFSRLEHSLFGNTTGVTLFQGDLADYRMFLTRIDSTVEANRRLFFRPPAESNALVKPASDGSVVDSGSTTHTPIVFFGGDGATAANWNTNKGTGGGYTVTGALGTSPNPPAGYDPVTGPVYAQTDYRFYNDDGTGLGEPA